MLKALDLGRPATAYMAARASEHLTADPARPAESLVTQRPRSPPTSDPRAPEQREPNRLLTDINWAPRGLQRLSGNRWPPAGQVPKSHRRQPRPSLKTREPRHPRSRHCLPRRSRCARNDHAAHQVKNPTSAILTPASRAGNDPQRDNHAHTTATTTTPSETQQRPYAILRYTGKGPVLSRDSLARWP